MYAWKYQTTPQPHLDGRVLYSPRGKVLGGSSSINGMVYDRGTRCDYDGWAAAGNDGWSYDEVMPYFKRAETYEPARRPAITADDRPRTGQPSRACKHAAVASAWVAAG